MQKTHDVEKNKKIVLEFYDLAIHKKDVPAAVQHLSSDFIQHNPFLPDGKQGFIDAVGGFIKQNPELKGTIKRVMAEDDLVALHIFSQLNAEDRGSVMVDIFRVEDGKIVEHWDVSQPIPETSVSGNSVY